MTREDLARALADPNVAAFLRVIREGESSQGPEAYRMRYGGSGKPPAFFDDLTRHPRIFEPTPSGQKSSAAGAYQATYTTWSEEQRKYGWEDFSEQSQDEFAVARIVYRGALESVLAGRFDDACRLCRQEWTSLPGGAEANRATSRARQTYVKWGGRFSEVRQPDAKPAQEVKPIMAPLIPIVLEGLAALIPALGKMGFGSGSEVAQRNVAAGAIVAEKLVEVTKAVNLQEAAEKIQSDPALLADARQAVQEVAVELGLMEVGGGIAEARKAAASAEGDWRKVFITLPTFVIVLLMPIVYFVVYHVIVGEAWSAEIKASVVSAVISGVLFAIVGFALGTSYGSQKKDVMLAK